jgi:hypothetical protein
MKTGLRVVKMDFASKLVICACMLHNMCIDYGDDGEDLDEVQAEADRAPDIVVETNPGATQRERKQFDESRRDEILRDFFT